MPSTPSTPSGPAVPTTSGPNIVVNGGFEEIRQDTKFASGWIRQQWGAGRGSWSVKPDRTNPRTGDRAIVMVAFADDMRPGAFCSLPLDKGTYVVSFWACADVGGKATVGAHCAGTDIQATTVGDEWQRVGGTVVVAEKKANASLRIWTPTKGARVFFDDVEVKAAK
jgi:hypothetical protein